MITYEPAPDIQKRLISIAQSIGISHDFSRVVCLRSRGSKSTYTIARCHGLPKIMQVALGVPTHYVIEIISEKFDRLDAEEKAKTLIHELLHIPKKFGGGFRQHDYVCSKNVNHFYKKYLAQRYV